MQITLNGESHHIDKPMNIDELLSSFAFTGRLAVEVNQKIVPKSLFCTTTIEENDCIEIVEAIGGG